jgi:hypothetical protein
MEKEDNDDDNSFSAFHDCHFDSNINYERITGNNVVFNTSADTSNISTISETQQSESTSSKYRLRYDHPLAKNTRTNPVWKNFQHFDILHHPDKRYYRCCLVCRQCGVDKAIAVGMKSNLAPLINHLRRHPEQYQEYMSMMDDLDSKTAVKSSKNQLTMSSFTTSVSSTKDSFKKAYLQWIVNNNLPLTAGEAPAFLSMIKMLNKSVFRII